MRLPICKDLLRLILKQVNSRFLIKANQPYLAILYKTIFVTAYYGLFRIGEITNGTHPIQTRDVHIATNKQKILFMLKTSKMHSEDSPPQIVKIKSTCISPKGSRKDQSAIETGSLFCPYQLLKSYIKIRVRYETKTEPFFVFKDRTAVPSGLVCRLLKELLKEGGINPTNYLSQSFREGRAGDLLRLRVTVETIKKLGRWKSNAVFKYLKTL